MVFLWFSHGNHPKIRRFGKEPRLERLAAERSVGATSGVPGRRGTAEGAVEHLPVRWVDGSMPTVMAIYQL